MRGGFWLGTTLALALGAAASAAPLGGRPDLDQMAGVYKHRFENGDVSGDKFTSEDILEVVKVSPRTAYFRMHTEFFNGHLCAIWGMADLAADALVYTSHPVWGSPCTLKMRTDSKGVVLEDVDGHCRENNCGARGWFDSNGKAGFLFSERRRIRYMDRLLKSHEYADALKEHGPLR